MSFTKTQRDLHYQAAILLISIETAMNLLADQRKTGEKESEWLRSRLNDDQIEYANVMKKLTQQYIPIEKQEPNAIPLHGTVALAEEFS